MLLCESSYFLFASVLPIVRRRAQFRGMNMKTKSSVLQFTIICKMVTISFFKLKLKSWFNIIISKFNLYSILENWQ